MTGFLVFAEPLLVKGSSTEFCFSNKTQHCISRPGPGGGGGSFILGGVIQSISSSLFMHACDTYASIGSAFLVKSQMPTMLRALGYFLSFSAVILAIAVLGGKEKGLAVLMTDTYPPSQAREPGFNISRERERERKRSE
jgi:hypothetical protein